MNLIKKMKSVNWLWIGLTALPILVGCGTARKNREEKKEAAIPTTVMEEAAPPELKKIKLPWSYDGETGPAFWGVIDPQFAQCGQGQKQSPVDLLFKRPLKGRALKFAYQESKVTVTDLGHTYEVGFSPGSYLKIGKSKFELKHMHIRSSSEHTLSGNELPLELQLFHRDEALGDRAPWVVVSIIVIEGQLNPVIEKLLPAMESKNSPEATISPSDLIPNKLTYYCYSGSLTYPPCTENVEWNVLNTPITASSDQILALRKYYSNNKRSIQPLNGRKVKNY